MFSILSILSIPVNFLVGICRPQVRIYGDMATVEGWYDFHVGERLTNCGVNAFQLVRTSDGWKIAHIASTIQTTGCERKSKE